MLWVNRQGFGATSFIKNLLSSPLLLLVILTLTRGLIYLSTFPPFLAPDETAHFEAIRLIGQEQKWPTAETYLTTPMHPEMVPTFEHFRLWTLVGLYSPSRNLGFRDNLFIHYYPTQIAGSEVVADSYLMLYHLSLAPFSTAMASFDLVTQVYLLRFISVILVTLTVMVAWFTIRSAFPKEKLLPLGVCSFILFWPMHTHVTASINADVLAELLGSLFFLVLVRIFRKGISRGPAVLLAGLVGLGFLTKPTTFFLLPTLIAAVIIYGGRKLAWSSRLIGMLIGGLVVFTGIGSILLYENAGGGRNLLLFLSGGIDWPNWSDSITPEALFFYGRSLNFAAVSFWGLFGWSNIHIPWMWVRILAFILFLFVLGTLIFIYRNLLRGKQSKLDIQQKQILVVFLLAILFSSMGTITPVIVTQSPSWGIHSRYYFPAIIPIGLYLFMGVRQLVPTQFQKLLWPGWAIGWALYDAAIFFMILLPFLYS